MTTTTDRTRTHWTLNCITAHEEYPNGPHDCEGYVAPRVYAATRPCECPCHDTRPRNWQAASDRANRGVSTAPNAETTHTIRWFGRISPCSEYPDGMVPRNRMMRAKDWGWDARCSCGWQSHTGGAINERIREMIEDHKDGLI